MDPIHNASSLPLTTIEDLPLNCLSNIIGFANNPQITNRVSKCWYAAQTLQQIDFYGRAVFSRPEASYSRIPYVKLNLVAQMLLFAPELAPNRPDRIPIVCKPTDSAELAFLRNTAGIHFAEFEARFPAEASMLCSFSILQSFLTKVNIENIPHISKEDLAICLSNFWEETFANQEGLRINAKTSQALSEKIVRMPRLKRLIIDNSEPSLSSSCLMIHPSFLPPTYTTTNHEEEIASFSFISQLTELETLEIEGVPSPELPKNLSVLQHFKYVRLSDCHLTQIPHSLFSLPALQTLNLRNNNFSSIPFEITPLPQTASVDLRDNPMRVRIPPLFYPMIQQNRLLLNGEEFEAIRNYTTLTPLHAQRQIPPQRLLRF